MPKRRERITVNPLKRDLLDSISVARDVHQPAQAVSDQSSVPVMETPSEGQGAATATDPPLFEGQALPRARPLRGRQTVTMNTRFAAAEAADNTRVVSQLRAIVGKDGSKLTDSHVTRAIWSLVRRAEDEFSGLAAKAPKLRRPAHGDHMALAEYEDDLADFILSALKRLRKDA